VLLINKEAPDFIKGDNLAYKEYEILLYECPLKRGGIYYDVEL